MRKFLILIAIVLLFYTRFVHLDWGKPYQFHPDEGNMVRAMEQLSCSIQYPVFSIQNARECFNPHFFAYGQTALYLGKYLNNLLSVSSQTSLRLISALASVVTAFVLMGILKQVQNDNKNTYSIFSTPYFIPSLLIITFSPYFIQFSHYGTTESLLMLFYTLIAYLSIKLVTEKWDKKRILLLGLISGLAIATKVSALSFVVIPIISIFYQILKRRKVSFIKKFLYYIFYLSVFGIIIGLFIVIFSPHYLLSFKDFIGTTNYEISVGDGSSRAFYTRQFEYSIPVVFQAVKVFPYVLGLPQYILFLLGFFFLSWKNRRINFLRISLLVFFIPTVFFYAKWTRFISPIFPLMTVFALLALIGIQYRVFSIQYKISINKFTRNLIKLGFSTLVFIIVIPGLAFLSIYTNPDVRLEASKWIYQNIPEGSLVLSETANVIDIPLHLTMEQWNNGTMKQYNLISLNFYEVDQNTVIQNDLRININDANYIFIPSRRIFSNHTCLWPEDSMEYSVLSIMHGYLPEKCNYLQREYPIVNEYYSKLFTGESGFKQVAKITSFPRIELFGKTLIEFPDEHAEETWTVFDHPVVRIYERVDY